MPLGPIASLITGLIIASQPTSHGIGIAPAPTDNPAIQSALAAVSAFNEFHLRKLHLARPDLIPYPFDYEVYC